MLNRKSINNPHLVLKISHLQFRPPRPLTSDSACRGCQHDCCVWAYQEVGCLWCVWALRRSRDGQFYTTKDSQHPLRCWQKPLHQNPASRCDTLESKQGFLLLMKIFFGLDYTFLSENRKLNSEAPGTARQRGWCLFVIRVGFGKFHCLWQLRVLK